MEAEVQIKIIELADKWVTSAPKGNFASGEAYINAIAKYFDQAYKAIAKSVQESK